MICKYYYLVWKSALIIVSENQTDVLVIEILKKSAGQSAYTYTNIIRVTNPI